MTPITDKEILNKVIVDLHDCEYSDDGYAYTTYEDAEKDIYIEASVRDKH